MSVPDDQPHTRTRLPAGGRQSPGGAPESAWHRLRTLGAVFVIVFALVVGVAVFNRTHGDGGSGGGAAAGSGAAAGHGHGTSGDAAAAQPTAPTGVAPGTGTTDGVPTGYPHTAEGAQSAAANYTVQLWSNAMITSATRHELVATLSAPAALTNLQSKFDASYNYLNSQMGLKDGQGPAGEDLVCRAVPVGTEISDYASGHPVVSVWATTLFGLAGSGSRYPVTENWKTVTLTLDWVNGDWRVSAYSDSDGPTPISGSQQASDYNAIAQAAKQFGGLRYAR